MAIREAAEYLKANEGAIHQLTSAQKLPALRVSGSSRLRRADIDHWIADQSEGEERE